MSPGAASAGNAGSVPRRPVAVSHAWRHIDLVLIVVTAAISALGVLMVYSTTRNPLGISGANPESEMKRQALYAVAGAAAFVVVLMFDYRRFLAWAPVLYAGSILVLLATLAVGKTALGAESWIQVGSIQVEPSELVKVTLIVGLAALLGRQQGTVPGRLLLVIIALAAVPVLLIYKQDALGSALVLAVVLIAMLLMGGTKGRHMAVLVLVAVVAMGAVLQLGVLKEYQKSRLTTFLTAPSGVATSAAAANPEAASVEYQLDQSKDAIAHGGLEGQGLYNGLLTNLSFVPNQSTDFIFTAVAEQFGFVGSALLLALFAIMVWRTWRAAVVARDLAGTLICVGVLAMITFQVFENVGMTMGIMPVAGITLPFMSYGGSSMVVDWAAVALVINVGMRRRQA